MATSEGSPAEEVASPELAASPQWVVRFPVLEAVFPVVGKSRAAASPELAANPAWVVVRSPAEGRIRVVVASPELAASPQWVVRFPALEAVFPVVGKSRAAAFPELAANPAMARCPT